MLIAYKHRARFKPLINELKVEPVGLTYDKHKVFGWSQCMKNQLTDKIFNYLYPINCVNNNIYNNFSFSRQISEVIGDKVLNLMNVKPILETLSNTYECNDVDMRENIANTLRLFYTMEPYLCIKKLNNILKIVF